MHWHCVCDEPTNGRQSHGQGSEPFGGECSHERDRQTERVEGALGQCAIFIFPCSVYISKYTAPLTLVDCFCLHFAWVLKFMLLMLRFTFAMITCTIQ